MSHYLRFCGMLSLLAYNGDYINGTCRPKLCNSQKLSPLYASIHRKVLFRVSVISSVHITLPLSETVCNSCRMNIH